VLSRRIPLHAAPASLADPTQVGPSFHVEADGVVLRGSWEPRRRAGGVQALAVDELSWNGVPLCAPGSWPLREWGGHGR
jgi:hypothetical protein